MVDSTDTHTRGSDVWLGRESGGVGVVGGWKRVLLTEMAVDVWRQLAALSTLEGRKQARLPSHEPLPLSTSKQASHSLEPSSVHCNIHNN